MFTDQTPVNTEAIVNRFLLYKKTTQFFSRKKKHAVIFSSTIDPDERGTCVFKSRSARLCDTIVIAN